MLIRGKRMNIEKITRVIFDKKEIEAFRVIANIDCTEIDCPHDYCPFDWNDGKHYGCIKGMIKEMMMKQGISWCE